MSIFRKSKNIEDEEALNREFIAGIVSEEVRDIRKMVEGLGKYKECEKCHGIFADYVVGDSEIRERLRLRREIWIGIGEPRREEYIHKPIYCHRCAPKKKKKATSA